MRKIKKKVAAGATIAAIATTGGLSAAIVACSPNKPEEKKPEERKETTPENTIPKQQGDSKPLDGSEEGGKDQGQKPSDSSETNQNQNSQQQQQSQQPNPEKKEQELIKLTPAEILPTYTIPLTAKNEDAQINLTNFTSTIDLVLNWGTKNLANEDKWKIEVELQQKDKDNTTITSKPLEFVKEKDKDEQTLQLVFGKMEDNKDYLVKSVKLTSVSVPNQIVDVISKNKNKNTIKFVFENQKDKKIRERDREKHVINVSYNGEKPLVLKSNQDAKVKVKFKLKNSSGDTDLDSYQALLAIGYQTENGLKRVHEWSKILPIKKGESIISLNQDHVNSIINEKPTHLWLIVATPYDRGFSPIIRNYRLNYENPEFVSDLRTSVPLIYIKLPVSIQ